MAIRWARQPVILMGMSRSGTSLVAQLLGHLGLFLGHYLDKDYESTYFYSVNSELLRRIHASWDNPGPMRYFLENSDAVNMTVECLEADLLSYRVIRFLGLRRYLRCRSLHRYDNAWGWKDPRNVLTLPLWLRLFPRARIIYIVRNGVDVASSVVAMVGKGITKRKARYEKRFGRPSLQANLVRAGFKGAARCLSHEGSFSLWEEYVSQAEETLAAVENDRWVIRFESFLGDPKRSLMDLIRFCDLEVSSEHSVDEVVRKVDRQRANAYLTDPVLKDFYQKVKMNRWMAHYGYNSEDTPS